VITPQAYTIPEFIRDYKVGRTTAYEEIKTGRLRTYTVGRARRISASAAEDWQRQLEASSIINRSAGESA
jgi:excisionase family DNA binding protein